MRGVVVGIVYLFFANQAAIAVEWKLASEIAGRPLDRDPYSDEVLIRQHNKMDFGDVDAFVAAVSKEIDVVARVHAPSSADLASAYSKDQKAKKKWQAASEALRDVEAELKKAERSLADSTAAKDRARSEARITELAERVRSATRSRDQASRALERAQACELGYRTAQHEAAQELYTATQGSKQLQDSLLDLLGRPAHDQLAAVFLRWACQAYAETNFGDRRVGRQNYRSLAIELVRMCTSELIGDVRSTDELFSPKDRYLRDRQTEILTKFKRRAEEVGAKLRPTRTSRQRHQIINKLEQIGNMVGKLDEEVRAAPSSQKSRPQLRRTELDRAKLVLKGMANLAGKLPTSRGRP